MAYRIAFLSRLAPLPMHSKLFGIEYLSRGGYEVFFLDLSGLLDGLNAPPVIQKQDVINDCEIIVISRLEELDAFVKEGFGNTIFIDCVAGLAEFDLNTGRIFKLLKKYNAKYYIISNGSIPSDHQDGADVSAGLIFRIKKALMKPRLLLKFFVRKSLVHLIKRGYFYQKPLRILGIKDSPIVIGYLKKYGMSSSTITPINSHDYDTYLEYKNKTGGAGTSSEICVFLDEDYTNHPDYSIFGIVPLNETEYISSMNKFFDSVEKQTGLSVVIAAHPKSSFNSENHPYGNRVFTKGDTVRLVEKSALVIAHSSTSISYPVLFRKPIVLAVTKEMQSRAAMIDAVRAFARELELTVIDVDSNEESWSFDSAMERHREYTRYLFRYVRNIEPVNKILGETIADVARDDLPHLELEKKELYEGHTSDQ